MNYAQKKQFNKNCINELNKRILKIKTHTKPIHYQLPNLCTY